MNTELLVRAKEIFNSMKLEEQVGQLFMPAFPGKDPHIMFEMVDRYGLAGFYISQDNAETFAEAAALTKSLQDRQRHPLPLIFGVDQEGAWAVLVPESTTGPGNLALGVNDDTSHTTALYRIFAREMRAAGYQAVFAPCADVNLNPENPIIGMRSFGDDAARVARHVAAAVTALRKEGILSTAKHFPGHGDTHNDTHRDIPIVDKSLETLLQQELLPFQAAIDAGVDMIMTSHILFPQIDKRYPATLSPAILTELLRKQMKFEGIIITDSMNMGAMRKHFSPEESSIKALAAGADIIMLAEEHYDHSSSYMAKQLSSIQAICKAVQSKQIPSELFKEKVMRVLQKKLQLTMQNENPASPAQASATPTAVAMEEHRKQESIAAHHGIQVFRDRKNILPLRSGAIAIVNTTARSSYGNIVNHRGIGPNQSIPAFDSFSTAFRNMMETVDIYAYREVAKLLDHADQYTAIIAVSEDYPLPGEDFEKSSQKSCIEQLIASCKDKLILLALRSPYELDNYPELHCYISTFSSRSCSAIAAAEYITGKAK